MTKQFPVPQTKHFETLLFPIFKWGYQHFSWQHLCLSYKYKSQKEINSHVRSKFLRKMQAFNNEVFLYCQICCSPIVTFARPNIILYAQFPVFKLDLPTPQAPPGQHGLLHASSGHPEVWDVYRVVQIGSDLLPGDGETCLTSLACPWVLRWILYDTKNIQFLLLLFTQ